jgi:hypothetical protein
MTYCITYAHAVYELPVHCCGNQKLHNDNEKGKRVHRLFIVCWLTWVGKRKDKAAVNIQAAYNGGLCCLLHPLCRVRPMSCARGNLTQNSLKKSLSIALTIQRYVCMFCHLLDNPDSVVSLFTMRCFGFSSGYLSKVVKLKAVII